MRQYKVQEFMGHRAATLPASVRTLADAQTEAVKLADEWGCSVDLLFTGGSQFYHRSQRMWHNMPS